MQPLFNLDHRLIYQTLGFENPALTAVNSNIVNVSAPIITMINQRQARGFQVGAKAFIRQILQPIG